MPGHTNIADTKKRRVVSVEGRRKSSDCRRLQLFFTLAIITKFTEFGPFRNYCQSVHLWTNTTDYLFNDFIVASGQKLRKVEELHAIKL